MIVREGGKKSSLLDLCLSQGQKSQLTDTFLVPKRTGSVPKVAVKQRNLNKTNQRTFIRILE